MATLQRVEYAAVASYRGAAASDRVSVADTRDTLWFLYQDAGETIGLCGLLRTSTGGRIKGVWVKPALRGHGHGRAMTVELIRHATDQLFMLRLEALAHNPKFYEDLGWQRIGKALPNGAVRLAKNY